MRRAVAVVGPAVLLTGSAAVPASWDSGTASSAALQLDTDPTCTFVINLNLRKNGATSFRELMRAQQAAGWTEMQPQNDPPPAGRFWIEVANSGDLTSFNEIVDRFRVTAKPNCKVYSTVLLRNAVDQVLSEWTHYFQGWDLSSQATKDAKWSTDMFAYAMAHPENELRYLTQDAYEKNNTMATAIWHIENPLVNFRDVTAGAPKWGGLGSGISADCGAAMRMARPQLDKVDVVGTMDKREDFAAFMIQLGSMAGFTVLPQPGEVNASAKVSPLDLTNDNINKLTKEQRTTLETVNACSQEVVKLAATKQQVITQGHDPVRIQQLLAMWESRHFNATKVGFEHEEPHKDAVMKVYPLPTTFDPKKPHNGGTKHKKHHKA